MYAITRELHFDVSLVAGEIARGAVTMQSGCEITKRYHYIWAYGSHVVGERRPLNHEGRARAGMRMYFPNYIRACGATSSTDLELS